MSQSPGQDFITAVLAPKLFGLSLALGDVFNDDDNAANFSVGEKRGNASGLKHMDQARFAEGGRKRKEIMMQSCGENAGFAAEGAFKVGSQEALADVREESEEILVCDLFKSAGAMNFHPVVPSLDSEMLVQGQDSIRSELLDPGQQGCFPFGWV